MGRQKNPGERYRDWIKEQLAPLLPRRWDLAVYTRKPDDISRPTVIVTLQKIERLPESPLGSQLVTYLVTVVDPAADWSQADALLDDEIVDLVNALDATRNERGLPILRWTSADRNTWSDTYLAFDITVTAVITATPKE
ncbi:hypothetical protein [Curtobacterium sp. MCBA15_004]|uniref:hypothetical protein n=1 Tax=Curtobacterium sp. MCBA15_004 TaxID=1898733 RepID=UPI0008DCD730|nr:hypothetical protein [Curtobacterium sp. MCBA15_004]WIA98031.1 hypothetical protein QOL16_06490 [Curtobacterium sp. MCBA15_004]